MGGRLHGAVYLLHPGPSLLVTLTFVAAASLALHSLPGPVRVAQLVLLMLPLQFAIGVVNDVADVDDDAAGKPYRPIVRGAVSRRSAMMIAGVLLIIGLGDAATLGPLVLLFAALGCAAGLAYDLGARRTVFSILPWWGGVLSLPLAAFAVAGRVEVALLRALPLSLLVAMSLHCANAYPDIDSDRAAHKLSLPALLGKRGAWWTMVLCGAGVVLLAVLLGADAAVWVTAGVMACVLALILWLRPARPFPALAIATAALATAWLAAIARS